MLTIKEAEEILKKEYHIDNFTYLMGDVLLPDYLEDKHEVSYNNQVFASVTMLGVSSSCEVTVFEVYLNEGTQNRRVAITQEMFRILRGLRINNAIVSFVNADKRNYRISLLTSKYEFDGDKIVKILSNPRRLSYSLGYGTKTKTAYKFLIEKGKVNNFEELVARFSVEVVNKQFYSEIATAFTELVGGERNGRKYEKTLGLYSVVDHNKYSEFGVRLIGRIMFCWFLREKRSDKGIPLVPDSMLSIDTIKEGNYYHKVLEPLFFELLNTSQNRRKSEFKTGGYNWVPYLNGGLFSPQSDDHYKYDEVNHCGSVGLVTVPDEWFLRLYSVLGEYNFTVDENTAYDIELSIDPEMLGRIFENLLAEINPETGENAKKSTGSFYTPRDIVDYMVDSSLLEYLKTKTGIDENKLRALISYFKEDDEDVQFSKQEKKTIIDSLYTITTLDPACGSGAFPIGMLQKIVYILQVLDPEADLWFDKATENVGILLKKEFEKKFNAGSLNYIRKLSVIQNSIFGIDIQPIAVEISRLRCFLSLIIEEKVDDAEENRGVNALPNLDFKFIIANSLISLDNDGQMSLFEDVGHIEKLKAVRDEYFNAESDRRAELKLEFSQIQQDMLLNTIQNYAKQASQKYTQLFSWKPFSNEPTGWFDPDWMFGIKDGFDVVIGNPPYVLLQGKNKDPNLSYFKKTFVVAKYKIDLYHLFIEKSINLLSMTGICSLITPSNFTTNNYCYDLRKFMLERSSMLALVFYNENVFEASVNNLVFLLKKGFVQNNCICIRITDNAKDFNSFNEFDLNIIPQEYFMKDEYLIVPKSDDVSNTIIERMKVNSEPLKNISKVNFGMQLRDRKKYPNDVTTNPDNLTPYHKKCYTGKDIVPFGVKQPIRWCYYKAEARCGGCWDENVQFYCPKLLIRQIGESPIVGIDCDGIPLLNTGFIISSFVNVNAYFLLGFLNSKLLRFYWKHVYSDSRKQFPKIKGGYLEKIPIRRDNAIEPRISDLAEQIVENIKMGNNDSICQMLKKIDLLCYSLYELSDEQIAIVEAFEK